MTAPLHFIEWRPLRRDTLHGFAKVRLPSGLEVADIGIHARGGQTWAAPPSRPMLDQDGKALRDETGKVRYVPMIGFYNHGTRASWSRQIIKALRAQYPDALPPSVEATT